MPADRGGTGTLFWKQGGVKPLEGGLPVFRVLSVLWGPSGPRAFIALCTAPTSRFKQLLLTQADKFSLAEVRVPSSRLGCSSRRALEALVTPAFLGLEPSLPEEGTECWAGELAVCKGPVAPQHLQGRDVGSTLSPVCPKLMGKQYLGVGVWA